MFQKVKISFFKKTVVFKMNERNSIAVTNTYSNLSDETKFSLNEINKIKDNLIQKFKKAK